MALRDLTDRSAVLGAINEADELGEPGFLRKYGFEASRRYLIEHDGRRYASKAILAAAHGMQFPDLGPLRSSDFSGGRETTEKARALGFTVVETDAARDDLGVSLARFMELFREARTARFGHDHPAVEALRGAASGVEALLPQSLSGAVVRPSVGQGNWAAVPWIAVLHPDVTTTTQHGVYPVLLSVRT
jgi:MrcB-like, N-terminal domain